MIIDMTDKYVAPVTDIKEEELNLAAMEASVSDEQDFSDAVLEDLFAEALTEATDFIPNWYIIKGADENGEARYAGLNPEHTSVRVITRGPYRIKDMLFFISPEHAQGFIDRLVAAKPSRGDFNLVPTIYQPVKPMHNETGYVQIETTYGKCYITN